MIRGAAGAELVCGGVNVVMRAGGGQQFDEREFDVGAATSLVRGFNGGPWSLWPHPSQHGAGAGVHWAAHGRGRRRGR